MPKWRILLASGTAVFAVLCAPAIRAESVLPAGALIPSACADLTIARCGLAIEGEWDADKAAHASSKLEDIAARVLAKFPAKPAYTSSDAMRFFVTMHQELSRGGYTKQWGATLSVGLTSKNLDCSDRTFIYLDIAQRIGLPLESIATPRHMFVRFSGSANPHINWETLWGREEPDGRYVDLSIIPATGFIPDAYLRPLTRSEMLGMFYLEIGAMEKRQERAALAERALAASTALYPKLPGGYRLRAMLFTMEHRDADAAADMERAEALERNPNPVARTER